MNIIEKILTIAQNNNKIIKDLIARVEALERGGSGGFGEPFEFYIGVTIYTALEGMTWIDWCESEYNIDGFVYNDLGVYDNLWNTLGNNGQGVFTSDVIEPNGVYEVMY